MTGLPETRIHKNAIKAWRITAFIYGFLWYSIGAFGVLLYLKKDLDITILILMCVASVGLHVLTIFVFSTLRWKRWRYEVNEQGVDMYRGIIILTRTMVPMNRIQHVDTKQGPIYRKFGLSSISLSTAATTHEIPALDEETAGYLRNMISDLVRQVKEDV